MQRRSLGEKDILELVWEFVEGGWAYMSCYLSAFKGYLGALGWSKYFRFAGL